MKSQILNKSFKFIINRALLTSLIKIFQNKIKHKMKLNNFLPRS